MKVSEITNLFEKLYPSKLSEAWDNTGLLIGSLSKEINKVLLCLDVTKNVIDEAKNIGAQLIISHHPFIFSPLKKITDSDNKQKLLMTIIKEDISVISMHTNLDCAKSGVNEILANTLELKNIKNINSHKFDVIYKIATFVPKSGVEAIRNAICKQGAGHIGNYSHCTFNVDGIGTFLPETGTNPFIGRDGVLEFVEETKIETVCKQNDLQNVIAALKKAHPYEEPAFDIFPLELKDEGYSYGKVGEYENPIALEDFLVHLKRCLDISNLRLIGKKDFVKRVAVFSGSYDSNFDIFRHSDADVLVTGDLKYHTALDAVEEGYCIADCGHFATEMIVLEEIKSVLGNEFENINVEITRSQSDPFVSY